MNRADDLFAKLTEKGEAAIEELIAARKSEELFLDFKRSGDHGVGVRLCDSDSRNFGRAISGFGNAEGGIIVWGVDCSHAKDGSDVASMKVPLQDAAAFASRLESAVSRCTIPAHSGVRNFPITPSSGTSGFVVSLIPKSNAAPLQTVGGMQFYMRAGSDFVPVPHGVLAGMFGRRPEPNLSVTKIFTHPKVEGDVISFDVGIAILNSGPGIARDIFLTIACSTMPCAVGSLAFDHGDLKVWTATAFMGMHMSYLADHRVRLAPDSHLMPCQLCFKISPPFLSDSDLKIRGTAGCEGGMPHNFVFLNTSYNVHRAYKGIMRANSLHMLDDERLRSFPKEVLGLEHDGGGHFHNET